MKGYDPYQQKAGLARKAGGLEGAVNGFHAGGSGARLDKIPRGLEARRKVLGDFKMNVAFRFGGTPCEVSERGLRLFAKESAAGGEGSGAVKARRPLEAAE